MLVLHAGIFYVDNTPTEQMRYERGEGIESASRSLPVEEHLRRWEQMKEVRPVSTGKYFV